MGAIKKRTDVQFKEKNERAMNIFCAQHKFKLRLSQAFFNFDYHGFSFQEIAKLDKCRLNDYPFFNS